MTAASPATLAIDTSGPRLNLAVLADGIVHAHAEDMPKGHAEVLFDRVAALLGKADLTYQALDRVAVTTGPGSFTGLRIGLAAARSIGLAANIPVIGIPTLLALSLSQSQSGDFTILVDARRGEVYRQAFSAPGVAISAAEAVRADTIVHDGVNISNPELDPEALARFAMAVDPDQYRPDPLYIRAADAKPQLGFAVAREGVDQ